MPGWLSNKMLSGRVSLHVGLMKTDLQSLPPAKLAVIYAETQIWRDRFQGTSRQLLQSIGDTPVPMGMLDNPSMYGRGELVRGYEILEDMRNQGLSMQKQMEKNFRKQTGIPMQPDELEILTLHRRGLEVLMCVVGVGLRPDKVDDLKAIWRLLMQPRDILIGAFETLRARERMLLNSGLGGSEIVYAHIDDDEWLEACEFVPSIIRNKQLTRIRYVEKDARPERTNDNTRIAQPQDKVTKARKSHWLFWVLLTDVAP